MIRPLLLLSLLPLAACGGNGDDQGATAAIPDGAERIECAVAGAEAFAPVCVVERAVAPEGLTLTIRAPNGGFRRLLVTKDGRGVIAADGAEPAEVTPLGRDRILVVVAGDRYRLPATVRQ